MRCDNQNDSSSQKPIKNQQASVIKIQSKNREIKLKIVKLKTSQKASESVAQLNREIVNLNFPLVYQKNVPWKLKIKIPDLPHCEIHLMKRKMQKKIR